jgi:hypothetical protein
MKGDPYRGGCDNGRCGRRALKEAIEMSEATTLNDRLAVLGAKLVDHGLQAHESELRGLSEVASAHGVTSPAVRLLVDRTQPDVARYRAFAVVASALTSSAFTSPATGRGAFGLAS